jgi:hypothetical protein
VNGISNNELSAPLALFRLMQKMGAFVDPDPLSSSNFAVRPEKRSDYLFRGLNSSRTDFGDRKLTKDALFKSLKELFDAAGS